MAVPRGLVVDWLDEVELLDDDTRSHVEVLSDDLDELIGGFRRCAVRLDEE